MKLEIRIDKSCQEPKVIVMTNIVSDEVNQIIKKLSEDTMTMIVGFKDNCLEILDQNEMIRIYASNGKVFAITNQGEYVLRLRLYEIEEKLDTYQFVRISKAEIINLKKVKSFDLSIKGTICVRLLNNQITYVSRRYVSKIKERLGV